MRRALILFHMAGLLFAVDPPYFVDNIEGWTLPDLSTRGKMQLIPGVLFDCKLQYGSPTYSSSECQLQGTELKIEEGGKTLTYALTTLSVAEIQYDPAKPSSLSYNFSGSYTETLPDGTVFNSTTLLTFERNGAQPNKLSGYFSLGKNSRSSGLAIVAEIK